MKILIVEDEVKLAKAIQRALELSGYETSIAFDGESGYELAITKKFDLLILDIMLPKMTGLEICEELRATDNQLPIVMLTAKGQVRDRVAGLNCGADDYMVKPFALEELLARINALTRRVQTQTNLLNISDLSLDTKNFKVTRADQNIYLSSREFSILEYLMKNAGKIVSKEQIVNHVWDYNSDVLPTTVEVHVKHLRDKIDKKFQPPLIQTIRGFGYMIENQT
ncbi:response regulator transcription factor [Patescibacteria group bacterium]|nr:response regulator transcription factor [Patescibacteria group bacterium]